MVEDGIVNGMVTSDSAVVLPPKLGLKSQSTVVGGAGRGRLGVGQVKDDMRVIQNPIQKKQELVS